MMSARARERPSRCLLSYSEAGERLDTVVVLANRAAEEWSPGGGCEASVGRGYLRAGEGSGVVGSRSAGLACSTEGGTQQTASAAAWAVARGAGVAAAEARVQIARWRLELAYDLAALVEVEEILVPAKEHQGVAPLLDALGVLDDFTSVGLTDPLAWFAAAEIARDDLEARAVGARPIPRLCRCRSGRSLGAEGTACGARGCVRRHRPCVAPGASGDACREPLRSGRPGRAGAGLRGARGGFGTAFEGDEQPMRLGTELFGVHFPNPVLLAAGTCGFGQEVSEVVDLESLGGFVTKSVTVEPRVGNAAPRVTEFGGGMLNSIGLTNPGLAGTKRDKLPWLRSNVRDAQVLVSVAGHTVEQYFEMIEGLDGEDGFLGFEVNLSCPNDAKRGGTALCARRHGRRGHPRGLPGADPAAASRQVGPE